MTMKNVEVDLDGGAGGGNIRISGDFNIEITTNVLSSFQIEEDGNGLIIHYHDLTFRASEEDSKKFKYLCAKPYEPKIRKKPADDGQPRSMFDELMNK